MAAAIVLAACEPVVQDVDAVGDWQLEAGVLDGRPLPLLVQHPVTMLVEPDRVSGTAACNHYGAQLQQAGASFRLAELGGTAMGCEPAVMDLETAVLRALGRVTTAARVDGRLLLSGPGVELRFVASETIEPGALIGTEWTLDTLLQRDVASSAGGDPATLVLDADGTFTASTGCRTLAGRYIVRGGEILVTQMLANGTCPPDLEAQDGQVIEVLGDGFRPTVEGERLTLTDPGGLGLGYANAG